MTFEDLTGHELRELSALLGRPFIEALEASDTDAMYAFVWIGERRTNPDVTFDEILGRPFSDVTEAFGGADTPDPTGGANGAD